MKSGSLRLRLLVAAAISVVFALSVAGMGMILLFQRHVEQRIERELQSHLLQLAAGIDVGRDGQVRVTRDLADPRFNLPLSGLYWQIDLKGVDIARSRSLWDEKLAVPTPPQDTAEVHVHRLQGPGGVDLFSQERLVIVPVNGQEQPLVLTAGVDHGEIDHAVTAFSKEIVISLVVLGLALIAAAWFQVNIGLKPLAVIRQRVERIRAGNETRLEGIFPDEVQPLISEINSLLAAGEQQLVKARQRAGDLAHGLKTPLTVLGALARDIKSAGLDGQARDIEAIAGQMRQHVERELVRARLASGRASVLTPLKPAVERLVATIGKTPEGAAVAWSIGVPEGAIIAAERDDLTELLGNLLENAAKWARSQVAVDFDRNTLTVGDDGPGIAEGDLARVLQRGSKLDEKTPGSGLGLAIAHDIAELYGLALELGRSKLGGLEIRISPGSPAAA
jgi:signal transduction histidine kinase